MSTPEFDLLIKNVRVVRPHGNVVHDSDIAIKDGQFALVAPRIGQLQFDLGRQQFGPHRLAGHGLVVISVERHFNPQSDFVHSRTTLQSDITHGVSFRRLN